MLSSQWVALVGLLILGGLSQPSVIVAQELEFSPQDQVLVLGEDGQLAVVMTEAVPLRTIEIEIHYDPTIIEGVSGAAGSAFDALPCFVWQEYTEPEAGHWAGFAVAIGSDCYITEPGELYVWDFTTIAEGLSPISTILVRLYDPEGDEILDVEIPPTTVIVGDDLSAIGGPPTLPVAPVRVVPNPFNPRTRIEFEMREPGPVRVNLFDIKGRHVRCLFEGDLQAGPASVPWDGLTEQGLAAPSGMYLFRLEAKTMKCTGRLTLAR